MHGYEGDSTMDRLEKRIDEKIDSKLGPVMDRLSVLEKTSSSARSGPSSLSDNGGSAGQSSAAGSSICSLLGNPGVVRISRKKHTWIDGGSGLGDHHQAATGNWSLIARVGAMRVRNTKIICYLKTPSFSSCKPIREAMHACVAKENNKLGFQGTTPFVTEEKLAWR